MRYAFALTDPRWLDATDEDICADLLMTAYRSDDVDRALHPSSAEAGEPGIEQENAARVDAFKKDDRVMRALGVLLGNDRPPPKARRIRLRGAIVGGDRHGRGGPPKKDGEL